MSDAVALAIIAGLGTGIPATIASIALLIKATRTEKKVDKLDEAVNGRMTQLLEAERAKALEAGEQRAHAKGRARTRRDD